MPSAWLFHAVIGTAREAFPIVQPQLAGYRNVYIYDLAAVAVVAVVILSIIGLRLGLENGLRS